MELQSRILANGVCVCCKGGGLMGLDLTLPMEASHQKIATIYWATIMSQALALSESILLIALRGECCFPHLMKKRTEPPEGPPLVLSLAQECLLTTFLLGENVSYGCVILGKFWMILSLSFLIYKMNIRSPALHVCGENHAESCKCLGYRRLLIKVIILLMRNNHVFIWNKLKSFSPDEIILTPSFPKHFYSVFTITHFAQFGLNHRIIDHQIIQCLPVWVILLLFWGESNQRTLPPR